MGVVNWYTPFAHFCPLHKQDLSNVLLQTKRGNEHLCKRPHLEIRLQNQLRHVHGKSGLEFDQCMSYHNVERDEEEAKIEIGFAFSVGL